MIKHFIGVFLVSTLTFFLGAFVFYNFIPLSALEVFDVHRDDFKLGATSITTIQGTDLISASRTTINNNFSSLNSNKVENGDYYGTTTHAGITSIPGLVSVGTLTTGTWNASVIGSQYGGTGSSSLSQYSVLLGSSTNPVYTVNGLGASGQFLTSQGIGAPPQWTTSAFDQASNYNLTGTWVFQSGTTTISHLALNNATTTINGVVLTFPSTASSTVFASSSVLTIRPNSPNSKTTGTLTWEPISWQKVGEEVLATASTSLTADIATPRKQYLVYIDVLGRSAGGQDQLQFNGQNDGQYNRSIDIINETPTSVLDTDVNAPYIELSTGITSNANETSYILFIRNPSANQKTVEWQGTFAAAAGVTPQMSNGAGVWEDTTNAINKIVVTAQRGTDRTYNVGSRITVYGSNF